MPFALPALCLVTAALLLGLSARPYTAMLPETCETRAVQWNKVTEKIPADDPDHLARMFGLLRRSCGI